MIDILITMIICIFIICVLWVLILGTIWVSKTAIQSIFEEFFDDHHQRQSVGNFIKYIKMNREMEFSALDRETAKYVYDTINDIYLHDRWRFKDE